MIATAIGSRERLSGERRRASSVPIARTLHVVLSALSLIAMTTALSLGAHEPPDSHDTIAVVSGLGVAALVLYMRVVLHSGWISASVVYLLLFWLFHFGLVFTGVVFPQVLTSYQDRTLEWMRWPSARLSMLLGLLGAGGFVAGFGLVTGRPVVPANAARANADDPALFIVGWIVMLYGVGMTLVVLAQHGLISIFRLSYGEFRSTVLAASSLFIPIQISQVGCLLALCGARARRWLPPFALWSAFAGLLLLVGLRNEALVPMVTFVITLTHRGVRFRRAPLVGVALAALLAMPAIATFRTVGFANRSQVEWTTLSPLATFTELGGTLRATNAFVSWIEQGDALLLGASYWTPFDRHFLVWVLPHRERIPIELDARVPGQQMTVREGPVGTSATGEAYYNFGIPGPFIYYACVGILFGWLQRRASLTPYHSALLGVVMFAFYWNIRGQWLAMPAQMTACVVLLTFCYCAGAWYRARAVQA